MLENQLNVQCTTYYVKKINFYKAFSTHESTSLWKKLPDTYEFWGLANTSVFVCYKYIFFFYYTGKSCCKHCVVKSIADLVEGLYYAFRSWKFELQI